MRRCARRGCACIRIPRWRERSSRSRSRAATCWPRRGLRLRPQRVQPGHPGAPQPGSAFKPIIYAAALQQGYTPTTIVVDRPLVYEDPESGFVWRPGNYKGRFLGELTLRDALSRSVNNATIHLLDSLELDDVMEFARAVGIESPLDRNLSLALGASGVSLLELARAYAVFPAGGRVIVPRFIHRVLDADGNVLLEQVPLGTVPPSAAEANGDPPELEVEAVEVRRPTRAAPGEEEEEPLPPGYAISERDAFLTTDMLRGVVVDPTAPASRRARCAAPWAARPAPPTSRATPGSWASRRTSWPACGSASTNAASSARARPEARRRCRSGWTSCALHSPSARAATSPCPKASSSRGWTAGRGSWRGGQPRQLLPVLRGGHGAYRVGRALDHGSGERPAAAARRVLGAAPPSSRGAGVRPPRSWSSASGVSTRWSTPASVSSRRSPIPHRTPIVTRP